MYNGPLETFVVYDVEVAILPDYVKGGWENPEGMGFASAVAYAYGADRYYFFLHEDGRKGLIELLDGKTAVTFNGIKFDSRVVLGNNRDVNPRGTTRTEIHGFGNYDLLLEYLKARYGFTDVGEAEANLGGPVVVHDGSFSLDGLAEGTLRLRKTGHGAEAPLLYQAEQYEALLAYNLHDVRLTRKLFEFAREYGFLVDREGRVVTLNMEQ